MVMNDQDVEDIVDVEMVTIRRNWNDCWRQADVPLSALEGIHWDQVAGGEVYGFARRSPRPMVMGYVSCDEIGDQPFAHSCRHGPPPHRIKVFVVAKDNPKDLMVRLKAQATVVHQRFRR